MSSSSWLALLFVLLGQSSAIAKQSHTVDCAPVLVSKPVVESHALSLKAPEWSDSLGLIRSNMESMAYGTVRTFFNSDWDTQVYFTATGTPDKSMNIPLVDPDAKAVVLFVHGSGTMKSSGANFVGNMSQLSNYGFAAVSIDLPFHARGSLRHSFSDANTFMSYMSKIVKEIAAYGKPVYLVGHSFGPDVILEMLSRDPHLVAGALGISPAGFNNVLREWYEKHTAKMKFGGEVATNTAGGEWADQVSRQFRWSEGAYGDPTLRNPNLKLNILYGDREEYYPAPTGGSNKTPIGRNTYDVAPFLRRLFQNANLVVAEGIGHYLFDHKDANGHVVVMRELLKMLGVDITNSRPYLDAVGARREARGSANKVAYMYRFDYLFQSWFKTKYSQRVVEQIFRDQDQRRAQLVLLEYSAAYEARMKDLMKEVATTEFTDNDFYREFKTQIDDSIKKNRVAMDVLTKYYQYKTGGSTVNLN